MILSLIREEEDEEDAASSSVMRAQRDSEGVGQGAGALLCRGGRATAQKEEEVETRGIKVAKAL